MPMEMVGVAGSDYGRHSCRNKAPGTTCPMILLVLEDDALARLGPQRRCIPAFPDPRRLRALHCPPFIVIIFFFDCACGSMDLAVVLCVAVVSY